MRYVVTGGAGFIGSNTVEELVRRGHSVVVLDDLSSGKEENLAEKLSPKLVIGENISQAASFVLGGGADAAILALSLVLAPATRSQFRYKEIPTGDYSPIVQACVALSSSRQKDAALKFETYLQAKYAAEVLRRFGFKLRPITFIQ